MNGNSFAYNLPQNVTPTPIQNALAIVEFRPSFDPSYYLGEFGFDWFRIGDTKENAFASIVEPQPPEPSSPANRQRAFRRLEREYRRLTIFQGDKYYVPYLTLYTQQRSESVTDGEKPPYEAYLQIMLTIFSDLEKIEFEYNKNFFKIDLDNKEQDILPDPSLTQCSKRKSSVIHITCHYNGEKKANEGGFPKNEVLKAWAYPKGSTDIKDRKLAGQLTILANNRSHRSRRNIVLVNVATNIDGTVKTGKYPTDLYDNDVVNLRRALYQSLTYANVEIYPGILDLTGVNDFRIRVDNRGRKIYGQYIYHQGVTQMPRGVNIPVAHTTDNTLFDYGSGFFSRLKDLFDQQTSNRYSRNYCTVFYFGEESFTTYFNSSNDSNTKYGVTQAVSIPNIAIFKSRTDWTLAHEVLHGCGVRHTFRDRNRIQSRHLFTPYMTDNIMDYGNTTLRPFTYAWQWRIVNGRLRL